MNETHNIFTFHGAHDIERAAEWIATKCEGVPGRIAGRLYQNGLYISKAGGQELIRAEAYNFGPDHKFVRVLTLKECWGTQTK